MATSKVKIFRATKDVSELETNINEYLATLKIGALIDVKYATNIVDNWVVYSAIVISGGL